MYSYSQILKQALNVAWKYPVLWVFGLFAAILGSAGEIELLLGGFQFSPDSALVSFWYGLFQGGFFTAEGLKGFLGLTVVSPLSLFFITFIFLIVLALTILIVWLVVVSQIALISQTIAITKNKQSDFRAGFNLGIQKFFSVLAADFALRAFGLVLLLLTGALALLDFPGDIFIFILIFDIFLVALLLFSFVIKFAVCGMVLKNWTFQESLKKGKDLFQNNWLVTLEVAVVVFVVYLLVNSIAVFVLSQIFVFSVVILGQYSTLLVLIFGLMLLIFFAVQTFLAIIHWAVWAIVFELLSSPKQVLLSKLKSVFQR